MIRVAAALSVAITLIGLTRTARTDELCPEFTTLFQINTERPGPEDKVASWSLWQQRQWAATTETATALYLSYRRGTLDPSRFTACLSRLPTSTHLENALPSRFFELTVQEFESSPAPTLRRLAAMIRAALRENPLLPFRLVGVFQQLNAPVDLPGGFHRGSASIFMNFIAITPNDWPVVFAHEVSHALDQRLANAVRVYGNPITVQEIANWAHTLQTPEQLPPDQVQRLRSWLMAGLDRGFLAEWRAWTVTLKIYQEGVQAGTWRPIPWIASQLSVSTFDYLDSRFSDPSDGLFGLPLVSKALHDLRQGIRVGQIPLDLGNLGNL